MKTLLLVTVDTAMQEQPKEIKQSFIYSVYETSKKFKGKKIICGTLRNIGLIVLGCVIQYSCTRWQFSQEHSLELFTVACQARVNTRFIPIINITFAER